MPSSNPGFSTLAIHAGAQPDPTTGARATPIYQTTAYAFRDADHAAALFGLKEFGNIYTRIMNPTQAVLEERVAALEGGTAALAVASGHAAQLLVFHTLLQFGDNFIAARQLYGGSINQFGHAFKGFDWQVRWADATDPASFEQQIDERTRAVFIESLANPGGTFVDIAAIAEVAHRHGLPLIVDNTMASPYLLRPLEHGADIVLHSLTKFLGGHGNSMGGIIFAIACRVLGLRDLGPAISPFNAFLILTGIETLPLRVQRHSDNALAVAKWLKAHPKVGWVNYAGLEESDNHALQQRYSPKGAGSVFTFGVKGGYAAGKALVEGLQLFSHLANIGDTRSLVIHPASTTHAQLTPEQQTAAGAGPDVVRLSVGIEDVNDIIADLEQSLAKV